MKFNFRKVASVIATTVMIGSTIGLAAAASFSDSFTKNGASGVAVVYGSNPVAAQADLAAIMKINDALPAASSTITASTVSGGDSVQLERSNDKFNLGDNLNDFYTSMGPDQMSIVLADGVYKNDDNDEFDYEQRIVLSGEALSFFQDNDFNNEAPAIGFNLDSGDAILNYTLDFTPDAADGGVSLALLETTDLTLLGRTYYVVDAANSTTQLTLLDTANSAIIADDGSTSKVSGYDVSVVYESSTDVILSVNGVQTNKLSEGDIYKVADDTYVAVKNILYSAKDTGVSKVEISVGSGKIVLKQSGEVEMNNEPISDIVDGHILNSYITRSGDTISRIKLEWLLDDDAWLATGKELVLPGFETIKLSMAGFNVAEQEMTKLAYQSDDKIKLSTSITDGDLDIYLLYANDSQSGWTQLGEKSTHVLLTNSTGGPSFSLNEDYDNYFVVSWINGDDSETYAYELNGISDNDGKNSTTLKNLAGGSDVTLTQIGSSYAKDVGQIKLTLVAANDDLGTATVTVNKSGSAGIVYGNLLVTKQGLQMRLPVNSTAVGDGNINLTADRSSWVMNFTEENADGDIAAGGQFSATLGFTSDGASVTSVSVRDYPIEEDSDDYVGYVVSDLATRTLYKTGGDQDTLEIEYHGDEASADIYVAESMATVVTDGSVGSLSILDSEVSSKGAGKNLIVVGGSCVNSYAASLLGVAANTCGADWTAKTGVSAGQYLIQTFTASSGKIATLVAGYNAGDTLNAATALVSNNAVVIEAGKKQVGTSETSIASAVTA